MPIDPKNSLYYKRARFTTRLPKNRLYDRAHFWLAEIEPQLYRVGFTKFATRMLGDLVEINFDVAASDALAVGQVIGSIEGFKAISELYCSLDGSLVEANPALDGDPTLLDRDPYDQGWLYLARGTVPEGILDLTGYTELLDATVDRILGHGDPHEEKKC